MKDAEYSLKVQPLRLKKSMKYQLLSKKEEFIGILHLPINTSDSYRGVRKIFF